MNIDKVKELIALQLSVDVKQITPESRVVEDLGADSLDIMEMLMTLEDEFNISIPDDDAKSLRTVQNIVDYIDSKQ